MGGQIQSWELPFFHRDWFRKLSLAQAWPMRCKRNLRVKAFSFQWGDCPSSLLDMAVCGCGAWTTATQARCKWRWRLKEGGGEGESLADTTKLLMLSVVPSLPLVFLSCETKIFPYSSQSELLLSSCNGKILRYSLSFRAKLRWYFLLKLPSVSLAEVNVSSLLCIPIAHYWVSPLQLSHATLERSHVCRYLVSQESCFTEGGPWILIPFAPSAPSACTMVYHDALHVPWWFAQ